MAEFCGYNGRSVLQPIYCELANQIDAKTIIPHMKDVLDSYQVDRICAEKTPFKENEKLLTTIFRLGPNGLISFMAALDQCYPNIALQIRQGSMKLSEQPYQLSIHPTKVKGLNQPKSFATSNTLSGKYKYLLRKDASHLRQLEGEILRKNRMRLSKMDQEKVLPMCGYLNNKYNAAKINARKTHSQKVETLLDILVKLGPDAFEEFVNALIIVNPELGVPIVEELRKHNLVCTAQ